MAKQTLTQDELYEYLKEHNLIVLQFAERMGVSKGLVGWFRHNINSQGEPMKFSRRSIDLLCVALKEVAVSINEMYITFGTPQCYKNCHGTQYDPGVVEPIRALSKHFSVKAFLQRVLGWSKAKIGNNIYSPASKSYGNITREDVFRINKELEEVAWFLFNTDVRYNDDDGEK